MSTKPRSRVDAPCRRRRRTHSRAALDINQPKFGHRLRRRDHPFLPSLPAVASRLQVPPVDCFISWHRNGKRRRTRRKKKRRRRRRKENESFFMPPPRRESCGVNFLARRKFQHSSAVCVRWVISRIFSAWSICCAPPKFWKGIILSKRYTSGPPPEILQLSS